MGQIGNFDGAGTDALDTLKTIDRVWKGMGLTKPQRQYGIALALVESSGIHDLVSHNIFYGLGQFNRATWKAAVEKYNKDNNLEKKPGKIDADNPLPDKETQAKIMGSHIRKLWKKAEDESKKEAFIRNPGKENAPAVPEEGGRVSDLQQITDTLWRTPSPEGADLRKEFEKYQGRGEYMYKKTPEVNKKIREQHKRRSDKIDSLSKEAEEIIRENDEAGNSPHSHIFPELADPNTPAAELARLRQVEATLTEAHHHIAHFAGLHSGAMNPALMFERNWPKQHQASRSKLPHIQTWIHKNPENPMPRSGGFPSSGFAPWPHAPHLPENPKPSPGHFPGSGPTPLPYAPQPSGAKPAPILCCRDPENHNILASQGFAAGIVTTGPSQDNPCPTGFVLCDTLRQSPTPQVDPGFSPQTRPIQLVGGGETTPTSFSPTTPPQTAVGAGVPGIKPAALFSVALPPYPQERPIDSAQLPMDRDVLICPVLLWALQEKPWGVAPDPTRALPWTRREG